MLSSLVLLFVLADYKPSPKDGKLKHGPAFVDVAKYDGSALVLEGSLPTSCHQLRVDFSGKADAKKKAIAAKVYSVADPKATCAQMLQPFSVKVPLQKPRKGTYSVMVNGAELSKIDVP